MLVEHYRESIASDPAREAKLTALLRDQFDQANTMGVDELFDRLLDLQISLGDPDGVTTSHREYVDSALLSDPPRRVPQSIGMDMKDAGTFDDLDRAVAERPLVLKEVRNYRDTFHARGRMEGYGDEIARFVGLLDSLDEMRLVEPIDSSILQSWGVLSRNVLDVLRGLYRGLRLLGLQSTVSDGQFADVD